MARLTCAVLFLLLVTGTAYAEGWKSVDMRKFEVKAHVDIPVRTTIRKKIDFIETPIEVAVWLKGKTREYRVEIDADMSADLHRNSTLAKTRADTVMGKIIKSHKEKKGWMVVFSCETKNGAACEHVRSWREVWDGMSCGSTSCLPPGLSKQAQRICTSVRP
jgi:hypothetical protein